MSRDQGEKVLTRFRPWLVAAAIYNLLWGSFTIVHDVYIGVREEVALMGDLNWVVWEDATEVEEAGAFLGDDAVE